MKKILFSILAVAALASCSKNDQGNKPYTPSDSPIMMRSSVPSAAGAVVEGRSPYIGNIATGNTLSANVVASLSSTDFATTANIIGGSLTSSMTWDAQGTAQSTAKGFNVTPLYYPVVATTPVYLVGVYPATSWSLTGNSNYQYTITGKDDVMTAPQVTTTKGDALALPTTYQNLAFTHRLTLVEVQVVAATAAEVTSYGNLTDLTVTKVQGSAPKNTIIYDLSNATNSTNITWGAGTATLPMYVGTISNSPTGYTDTPYTTQTQPLTTTAQFVAYSLVPPITVATAGDVGYSVTVKTVGMNVAQEVPVTITNAGNTEGKRILITITFTSTPIKATATVTDWINGGSGSGVVL